MNNRKIIKGHQRLISSAFNVDKSTDKFQNGIIYTLYSEALNSIKVGFAENEWVLENKLSNETLFLLEWEKGNMENLLLLVNTLKELGFKYSDNLYFKYSNSLIRHLYTLGWPIGRSLYKRRKIKKELLCA